MALDIAINMQTLVPWAILMAGLIYETTMFIYRKAASGEQFSLEKYALTYGYVGLLAIVAYVTTGIIPGVSEIMVQLTSIPDVATILPLIFAVIMGVFQQGSRVIQGGKTVATTATVTPIGEPVVAEQGGRVTVAGIYGGSAAGNTPVQQLTFNINQIPDLFFDLIGVTTGVIALKMAIDGKTMVKWMPNIQSDDGVFNAKVNKVGERMPFGFNLWNAAQEPGTHIITISTGQFDANGKNPKWLTTDNFVITLTGVKPLE
jgi:hypothetical protein